jgi:hypothetical protein
MPDSQQKSSGTRAGPSVESDTSDDGSSSDDEQPSAATTGRRIANVRKPTSKKTASSSKTKVS